MTKQEIYDAIKEVSDVRRYPWDVICIAAGLYADNLADNNQ